MTAAAWQLCGEGPREGSETSRNDYQSLDWVGGADRQKASQELQ